MTDWTDVIGRTLVHFVWEGTAIAAATALVLLVLPRAAARGRYAAACAGMISCLAAPPLTALTAASMTVAGARIPVTAGLASAPVRVNPTRADDTASMALEVRDGSRAVVVDERLAGGLLAWVVALWALGVLVLTARLAAGWWRVRRLHAEAVAAPASAWLDPAQRIADRLGLARPMHVVDSIRVATPAVVGWLQPVVLLPVAALANLSPAQVQAILAHELAHVRRHDFLVNMLQAIAETLLFYHPAVWWLSAQIRTEREHCCDDIAVDVCGDAIGYAEALTVLASFSATAPAMLVASTGGSLLSRVRRLLGLRADLERRRPRASLVLGATVVIVALAGMRLLLLAQTGLESAPGPAGADASRIGPADINRMLGYDLFPGPAHYAGDDPVGARAWEVTVASPGGPRSFIGFTARSLIRYAYGLDGDVPVLEAPSWLDLESRPLHAATTAANPDDADLREAIRVALESEYGMSLRRETRLFPVYGLQAANTGGLGANLRHSTADCVADLRTRPDVAGPSLQGRGQMNVPFCGVDRTIWGPRGMRVTISELVRSLHGYNMDPIEPGVPQREVVDQTGLTGVYDFELNLGFLPAAAIASNHYQAARVLWPLGIRTFPQAIEEQLGLRLVPSEVPREVVVIVSARQQRRE